LNAVESGRDYVDYVAPTAPGSLNPRGLLGVDLVAVAEVARALEQFGDRYLNRVYTPAEIAYCTSHGHGRSPAPHLAARFAAKEATFKALHGQDEALDWRSIEVLRLADGSSALRLHGGAHALAQRRRVQTLRVSLSHDGDYAVAVVAGEAGRRRPGPGAASRIARKRRIQRP
jgi:holo-[acyl-carrier protein] synthase